MVSRKACLAGNGPALSKRHNAADDRFLTRPKGACLCRHCGVALFVKGWPFPAERALHCRQRHVLNVTGLVTRYTILMGNDNLFRVLDYVTIDNQLSN